MARYFSMHIIACMTRQALKQLIDTLQAAQEFRFIRASASQMAGRLLCEFDAPDQDTLLRFLEEHHPRSRLMFWRFTVRRWRKSAMMIASPTAASAAATVITKNTNTWPAEP